MEQTLVQINTQLQECNTRLQKLMESMGIVMDEQQIMSMDIKEINARLDAIMKRLEEREQRQTLKVVR
ncbi:hypothetical protein [Brevibacillus agri]|uniref:hypothetical protein n=1 Tax=Brevibacillus agri TaxID=51101 RepID=UPI003D1C67DB